MKQVAFIPSNKQHSIEEFSLAFFFSNKIENFESFTKEIIEKLKDEFPENDSIQDESIDESGKLLTKEVGFELIRKISQDNENENKNSSKGSSEKNKNVKVEQALVGFDYLPMIKQKAKISYHNLNYTNWEDIREKIVKYFKIISKIENNICIEAFNLTYADAFHWNAEQFPQLDSFFKTDSPRIPMEILTSNKPCSFSITISTEEFLERKDEIDSYSKVSFDDILKVSISQHKNKDKYRILIRHSMVHILKEKIELTKFFEDDYNFNIINLAQKSNKNLLRKILKPRIQELINLNKIKQ